jgi:hypothetical protein
MNTDKCLKEVFMIVGNIAGFDFVFEHKGQKISIPNDRKGYTVPDDIDINGFKNMLKVLVPPVPKPIPKPVERQIEVLEIDLDKVEVKEVNEEEIKPRKTKKGKPLCGVKIKKERRAKLLSEIYSKTE